MNVTTITKTLAVSLPLLFGSTMIEAQKIQNSVSILCRPTSSTLGSRISNQRIIISGLDCSVKGDDSVLYKSIEQIMRVSAEYQNAIVIAYGREMKPNDKSSKKETRFTDNFFLKIDFNHKDGVSSTTVFYIYNEKGGLTKISNSYTDARLREDWKK